MLKIGGDLGAIKRLLIRIYRLVPLPLRRRASKFGPVVWLRQRYFERDTGLHDEYYTAGLLRGRSRPRPEVRPSDVSSDASGTWSPPTCWTSVAAPVSTSKHSAMSA